MNRWIFKKNECTNKCTVIAWIVLGRTQQGVVLKNNGDKGHSFR